jgi:hypothetical protein
MQSSYRQFLFVLLPLAASASWQAVGQVGTDTRPGPREAALGTQFWSDSARYNLFSVSGNAISLVPGTGKDLTLRLTTSGLSLAGSGSKASESHPVAFELLTSDSCRYGLRLGVEYETQELQQSVASPDYQATRLHWGMDVGANLVGSRFLSMGFGLRGRYPSTQTQDTSGSNTSGTYERWQPSLEALRVSLGSRIADFATITARVEAGFTADSLNHTPVGTTTKSQHRFGHVVLPFWGFGAQFDRANLPATGFLEYGFGTTYRLGVLKTFGNGANIDMPQLTTDSSRFVAGASGRIDKLPDHLFRPSMALYMISGSTQAYAPIKGAQSTDFMRTGPEMIDTNWTVTRTGLALGLGWEWNVGVKISTEWERQSQKLSRGAKLLGGATDKHVDHRVSLGAEIGHTVIPALREKVPAGTGFCLRMGMRKQSLAGMELEPGFLKGLVTGYEPVNGAYPNLYSETYHNWAGVENQAGLNPTLGAGSEETAYSVGIGGSFLDGKLGADAALIFDTWQADATGAPKLSGTGWNLGIHWSL